jgi:two-component system, OmpR family, sensor histidine kinase TctE
VAHAINEFLDKLQNQSQALKDFVAHASHELKTPLMSISSTLDYMRKSKNYDDGFATIKQTLTEMHTLIENLLLLAKAESQETFETHSQLLAPVITRVSDELAQHYVTKHISCELALDPTVRKSIHEPAFEIIVKNLLDNSYKYTPE